MSTAPMREADWRFLLPAPAGGSYRNLVLLGASPGVAERLREEGIAARVHTSLPDDGSADAVVVLAGGRGERPALPLVRRAMGPEAVLYYEVDRRVHDSRWTTPARLHRQMRRLGLGETGIYWVRPDFAVRRLFIPLDRPGALAWYLETIHAGQSMKGRAAAALLRRLWKVLPGAVSGAMQRFAVTAAAAPNPQLGLAVLSLPGMPAELQDASLRPVMVTNGADDLNRVVLLPFGRREHRPRAVVKLPRIAGRNALYEQEQETLLALRGSLDAALADALPRPLARLSWGEISVGVESYVHGESLARSTGSRAEARERKIEDLRLALAWITEFNAQAQLSRGAWSEEDQSRWVEEPIRLYRQAYRPEGAEAELLDTLSRRTRTMMGTELPIVWHHYAYGPWNVARDGDQIRVFDWEGSGPALPLFDLLYFVGHWYDDFRGVTREEDRLRGLRTLLTEPAPEGSIEALLKEEVARYLARLRVDPAFLPAALTLFWLDRALSTYRRQGQPQVAPRNDRRAYLTDLAEHRETLYGSPPASFSQTGVADVTG
jgi:hypothetical protein